MSGRRVTATKVKGANDWKLLHVPKRCGIWGALNCRLPAAWLAASRADRLPSRGELTQPKGAINSDAPEKPENGRIRVYEQVVMKTVLNHGSTGTELVAMCTSCSALESEEPIGRHR
uniref:Uncharacterized protein n=1 Tax=Oryza nivara TaxID=4536 RepID=A0A0E0FG04_ORYNI